MENSRIARLSYDVTKPSGGQNGEKPPIILLHGMTSTKETWNVFKQELADKTKRQVYALDARNHGDSDWKEPHSYQEMARDVSHFMDEMRIPTAVLVGHSMGGKTAMFLATTEPDKVEKLAIEDISPKPLAPKSLRFPFFYLELMKKSLDVVPPESDIESAKKIVWEYIHDRTPKAHASGRKVGQEHASSTLALEKTPVGFRWKVNIAALEKLIHADPVTVAGTYAGPTVFIYGTKSVYSICDDKDFIQHRYPRSTFVPIEGATHLVHYEFPEEFLNALLDFITQ